MIGTKLFRRHYSITAIVVVSFIGFGFLISTVVMRVVTPRPEFPFGPGGPHTLFARWVEDLNPKDRPAALRHIQQVGAENLLEKFFILDQDGKNLSSSETLSLDWASIQKPEAAFQFLPIKKPGENDHPHPPFGESGIIRFPGSPPQYLYSFLDPNSHLPPMGPPPPLLLFSTIGSLLLSVLIGVGFALFLLFRSMSEKMALVDSVISELQKGNLKARFPTDQTDELGLAMTRFNTMADEIERLVERIRSIEKSRMALLQDLTHDLRTPVASLKNLLATIEKKDGASDQAIRKELLALARKEVEYFERLVEDLLVLAQVSEPSYQSSRETVSVLELIEDEAGSVEIQGTAQEGSPDSKEKIVKIESKINSDECLVTGDAHLLRRLLRNALENAYSFAESKVTITVDAQKNELRLLIQDDGQGFSNEGLKDFGVRKVSRAIQKDQGNRLSVGLGSVIMKTVAELHRGKLAASNRVDASGKVIGAEVLITLPKRY